MQISIVDEAAVQGVSLIWSDSYTTSLLAACTGVGVQRLAACCQPRKQPV